MRVLMVHPSPLLFSEIYLLTLRLLARGQTNFFKMLWKFRQVYSAERLLGDHSQPVRYEVSLPAHAPRAARPSTAELYVHSAGAVA